MSFFFTDDDYDLTFNNTNRKKQKFCLNNEKIKREKNRQRFFKLERSTETVLFSEWTIYIAQKWFHVCLAVPFPTCATFDLLYASMYLWKMRERFQSCV